MRSVPIDTGSTAVKSFKPPSAARRDKKVIRVMRVPQIPASASFILSLGMYREVGEVRTTYDTLVF